MTTVLVSRPALRLTYHIFIEPTPAVSTAFIPFATSWRSAVVSSPGVRLLSCFCASQTNSRWIGSFP